MEGAYGCGKPNRVSRSVNSSRWLQRKEKILRLYFYRNRSEAQIARAVGATEAWVSYVLGVFGNWLFDTYASRAALRE